MGVSGIVQQGRKGMHSLWKGAPWLSRINARRGSVFFSRRKVRDSSECQDGSLVCNPLCMQQGRSSSVFRSVYNALNALQSAIKTRAPLRPGGTSKRQEIFNARIKRLKKTCKLRRSAHYIHSKRFGLHAQSHNQPSCNPGRPSERQVLLPLITPPSAVIRRLFAGATQCA